jgi:tetratricopeptide (TPR) repeat protein
MSDTAEELRQRAYQARRDGRLDDAKRHYQEAAELYRADGDVLRLAHTIRHLGDIHRGEGHPELAGPCYEEALALYRGHEHTPPLDLANTLRGYGILEHDTGNLAHAKALWEEARDLYAAVDVQPGVAEGNRRLDLIVQSLGTAE